MTFEYPNLLWFLGLLGPGLALFCWWAWRRRQQLIALFVQSRLLAQLTVGVSTHRQKWRLAMVSFSALLILFCLARPQWGFDFEEAKQRGLDIVVAIDTSRSMLATDLAPNRLERAKLAALDLLRAAHSDRLGLVAFAGSAFLQCPLTVDDAAFRQSLKALDSNIIPQGGTALAEAIRTAETAFGEKNDNYKVLVLFTDGEDHDGKVLETARDAGEHGLRIFTVGVGTPSGDLLPIPDGKGGTAFLKDEQGHVVKSRLDEGTLQQVAESTGGFYVLLTGANPIDLLYERGLAPLPKAEFAARRVKRYHERYQWFLAAAICLLMAETFLTDRRRTAKSPAQATSPARALAGPAILVALCLLAPWRAQAAASPSRAMKALRDGQYAEAQTQFETIIESGEHNAKLQYNAGNAAYLAGNFDSAASHFRSALLTDDLALQTQSYYNLGNAQFRLGETNADPNEKQSAWQQALQHYESALKLNAQDADAQFNLDYVKKKLEELQQQQQQQQQDKQDNQDSSDKKDESKSDQNQSGDSSQEKQSPQDQNKTSPPPGQDQKQQESHDDPSKNDPSQPSQPQTPPGEEENQKQESKQDGPGAAGEQNEPKEGDQGQAAHPATPVMTPEQARRLLESVQGEERPLIFLPQQATNHTRRVVRDW